VQGNDLTLYERHAHEWWNPRSAVFRSLQSVNNFRTEQLREWLGPDLTGRTVLDLGCGGGLLAAPLARAGARVIGIDLSQASLRVALEHAEACFVRGDVLHAPLRADSFDIVLLADVLEHVNSIGDALDEAARLLRPGGLLYVNTINRTQRSKWLAIFVAEGLRLVPRGTHDHALFVSPEDLREKANARNLRCERLQGETVDVLRTAAHWTIVLKRSVDVSVTYSALFRKVSNA
jgi:2-polyprenyl-6-hydroxyphenyl methylase / 3-demethylubiquinone-9 3-methyltransferase